MKKIKDFLEQWIKFEIYDTEEEGIYQIYAGVSKDGIKADLSPHGFNLYFGNSKNATDKYYEYGFSTLESFKKGTMLALYYISRISAEEIVGQYIVDAVRKGKEVSQTDVKKYIWEGKTQDCPEKWSVYIDVRSLE